MNYVKFALHIQILPTDFVDKTTEYRMCAWVFFGLLQIELLLRQSISHTMTARLHRGHAHSLQTKRRLVNDNHEIKKIMCNSWIFSIEPRQAHCCIRSNEHVDNLTFYSRVRACSRPAPPIQLYDFWLRNGCCCCWDFLAWKRFLSGHLLSACSTLVRTPFTPKRNTKCMIMARVMFPLFICVLRFVPALSPSISLLLSIPIYL